MEPVSVSIIGLGGMGKGMASRLHEAGHALTVWNRTASAADELVAKGHARVGTPAEAVAPGGVVITMVANDAALEAVTVGADGFLERVGEGGVHLSMSTVSPELGDALAERYVLRLHLPERHARFLDVGDTVQVSSRGVAECGEDLREGAIRQVYPRMDDGRVVADVEVGGLGDFFVGERTCVYVATGTRQTIVIPSEYLFRRFGVAYVRVHGVGEVVVQPGQSLPDGVEILAGLRPGGVVLPPSS